jgi:NTE family protein
MHPWRFIPVCLLMGTLALPAQSQPYQNLVFEGAGIRGIAYTGAVEELEARGILSGIERYGGTSAGAIIALALALDYDAGEIREVLRDTKFQRFNDGGGLLIGGVYRLLRHYGWYRSQRFSQWLATLITAKAGQPDLTFQQLYDLTGHDFYAVGTNLTQQRMEIFSRETHPQMRVQDAVRISMSIPLYFEAPLVDAQGRIYRKPPRGHPTDVIVDGGIIGNFPIQIFDQVDTMQNRPMRNANPATLGIKIESDEQIDFYRQGRGLHPQPIGNLREYVQAFYLFTLETLNSQPLTPADWQRTILLSSAGIGPKIKRLSDQEVAALVESGRAGVVRYFEEKRISPGG